MKLMKEFIICLLICLCCFLTFWLLEEKRNKDVRPLESYLIQEVKDPNWIINYGVDLESRLVYNVALLNQIVNRQGVALQKLLEEPNK